MRRPADNPGATIELHPCTALYLSILPKMLEAGKQMNTVKQWSPWELTLRGPDGGNPFVDVQIQAEFTQGGNTVKSYGFYDGDGVYKVRFLPRWQGLWQYRIRANAALSGDLSGTLLCTAPAPGSHGPVRVARRWHFAYEDGTAYAPIGTTCYAWIHQPADLRAQTLDTLAQSPFNKIRMCVFPKYYDYNREEPQRFPYERTQDGGWDYTRFHPAFFWQLEQCILSLCELGIQADIILFHPYDKWGFANMGAPADDRYLRYIAARLAAYPNVWGSLANEYDLMELMTKSKTTEDWERFADILMEYDPYGHLRSIHNCFGFYDHTRPWITHCSIQRQDVYKTAEYTDEWRSAYGKPVVIDECGYEGNINHGWGNLPAQELVRRCWEGTVRGGYVGHGETYLHPQDILWWSKGGTLHGQSPARMAFLRSILADGPQDGLDPISFGMAGWDLPCGGRQGEYYLFYFGFSQPCFREFTLPQPGSYQVDVIDTWNMTIEALPQACQGTFRVALPGRSYIAVRMRRLSPGRASSPHA